MNKLILASSILVFLAFLFALIGTAAQGWAVNSSTAESFTTTIFIGLSKVTSCYTGPFGSSCIIANLDSNSDPYYKAGQACMGLFIPAMIIWVVSFALLVFLLVASLAQSLLVKTMVGKFVPFKWFVVIPIVVSTVLSFLAWIVWVGVAKPKDNGTTAGFSFGLSIIATIFSIAAAVCAAFADYGMTPDISSAPPVSTPTPNPQP
eukprot:TRINITY_DN13813_c0_g1_i1.p1 TRINITY_DN13813_c0_g1~~TRINITY_DN13813_c0_g1_i1.p1  ORF type:complete len:205 (+),score=54.48 TRINITY_DN13813_c0_g1_i1:134-748(+)